jgi:NAD(P)-dependent dehydrogenase (short-subunit alcohol dehydrogenase family)
MLCDGPVDVVNSAGIVEDDVAAVDMPVEQFDKVYVVNIASMSGNHIVNFPQRNSAYNSSKAAVTALTKSLAVEWGPHGVRVNALSPGYVDTPLNALKQHIHELWKKDTVNGRFATPEEVSAAVAFLLSDEASYFLGSELLMDGGSSLR